MDRIVAATGSAQGEQSPQQAPPPAPATPSILAALNPGSVAYMLFFGGVAWGGAQLAQHLWETYGKGTKKRARKNVAEEPEEEEDLEEEFSEGDEDEPEDEEE